MNFYWFTQYTMTKHISQSSCLVVLDRKFFFLHYKQLLYMPSVPVITKKTSINQQDVHFICMYGSIQNHRKKQIIIFKLTNQMYNNLKTILNLTFFVRKYLLTISDKKLISMMARASPRRRGTRPLKTKLTKSNNVVLSMSEIILSGC